MSTTRDESAKPTFDSSTLRRVFSHYPTGVAVITAIGPDGPVALVVTSFTSVSLQPPLVSICAAHTSTTWPIIAKASSCCVNLLAASQRALCQQLAGRGADRFEGVKWSPAASGAPILPDVVAWFDCRVAKTFPAGDHEIVLLEIVALEDHPDLDPLVFHRSAYRHFGSGID